MGKGKAKKANITRRHSAQALEHMVAALEERIVELELENVALKQQVKANAAKKPDEKVVEANRKLLATIMRYRRMLRDVRRGATRETILKECAIQTATDMEDTLQVIAKRPSADIDHMVAGTNARLSLREVNANRGVALSLMLPGVYDG